MVLRSSRSTRLGQGEVRARDRRGGVGIPVDHGVGERRVVLDGALRRICAAVRLGAEAKADLLRICALRLARYGFCVASRDRGVQRLVGGARGLAVGCRVA